VSNIDHARPNEESHIANIAPHVGGHWVTGSVCAIAGRKGEAINVQNFSIDRREDRKTGGKGK
jgi:hypothetical protein